jgi:hypothetical protein
MISCIWFSKVLITLMSKTQLNSKTITRTKRTTSTKKYHSPMLRTSSTNMQKITTLKYLMYSPQSSISINMDKCYNIKIHTKTKKKLYMIRIMNIKNNILSINHHHPHNITTLIALLQVDYHRLLSKIHFKKQNHIQCNHQGQILCHLCTNLSRTTKSQEQPSTFLPTLSLISFLSAPKVPEDHLRHHLLLQPLPPSKNYITHCQSLNRHRSLTTPFVLSKVLPWHQSIEGFPISHLKLSWGLHKFLRPISHITKVYHSHRIKWWSIYLIKALLSQLKDSLPFQCHHFNLKSAK